MKLYELKKGEHFTAYLYYTYTDKRVLTITGEFLGMDGAYGKVQLSGVNGVSYFNATFEVEKVQ